MMNDAHKPFIPLGRLRRIFQRLAIAALVIATTTGAGWNGQWKSLKKDGLHDPSGPGMAQLQQPADALSILPGSPVGNQVDWVQALEKGVINPRTNIFPETNVDRLDSDVIMPRTSDMPMVRFPHKQHTEWLDCSNCHDHLFESKAGATKGLNMLANLNGEYCGQCHGAVAFPQTECNRCHSVPRTRQQ